MKLIRFANSKSSICFIGITLLFFTSICSTTFYVLWKGMVALLLFDVLFLKFWKVVDNEPFKLPRDCFIDEVATVSKELVDFGWACLSFYEIREDNIWCKCGNEVKLARLCCNVGFYGFELCRVLWRFYGIILSFSRIEPSNYLDTGTLMHIVRRRISFNNLGASLWLGPRIHV